MPQVLHFRNVHETVLRLETSNCGISNVVQTMCFFPITTYSFLQLFLSFFFTLFGVFKNIHYILASPNLLCWFLVFLIFYLCSAPLFYPWGGSAALWTPTPLAWPFLFGYLSLCNIKEHGKKAAILGNMLNKLKQYLKKLTITLTGSELHAYPANAEAATHREKWGKNIANRAINAYIWREWIVKSSYDSAVFLNNSGMKCNISIPSPWGRIVWCIFPLTQLVSTALYA